MVELNPSAMSLGHEIASGRSLSALPSYIDTFNPEGFVPADRVRLAGEEVVPPLLRALAERQLSAHVTNDLSEVVKVYRDSAGGMRLIKPNDPRFHPDASPTDTNILILKRGDLSVGCVASRLIWCENTLAEEMESGRFWVSDPFTMWFPEDRCIVNANTAKKIGACYVVLGGSVYLDPSVRGGTTLAAMLRLHRLWLLCHWRWSWLVGLLAADLISRHAFDIYGVQALELGVWRTREGDSELHRYQLGLHERGVAAKTWLRPDMGDLSRLMGRPPKSVLPSEAMEPPRHEREAVR
jgi:hypothetical protein